MKNEMNVNALKHRKMVTILVLVAIIFSAIMPVLKVNAYAADGKISMKMGQRIDYSNHYTHYFYAGSKDRPIFCAQPDKPIPAQKIYSYNLVSPYSILAKALYYGYGGPGYSANTERQLSGEWRSFNRAYALSHIIVAKAYDSKAGGNDAFWGLDSTWKAKAKSIYNYVKGLPYPPANYRAYVIKTGNGQDMAGAFNETGKIEIQKKSANEDMSKHNSEYRLYGAEFGVYHKNKLVGIISTDTSGYGTLDNVLVGEYTVKEIKAPMGYAVDTKAYNCKVSKNKTSIVKMKDYPKNNPIEIILEKGDKETGKAEAQGSAKLEGAVYEIRFFKEAAERSLKVDRTWRVVTDKNGRAELSDEYLDKTFENDEFYHDSKGKITLPLGTVNIQEIKAPEGYLVNSDEFWGKITDDGGKIESVKTFNIPKIGETESMGEQIKRGDIKLVKVKDGSMERLSNIQFKITSKTTGESHVICTDENGMIDTSSSFNPHKNDTNGGKAESGLWFGDIDAIDDEKGALIYDYYTIDEIRGEGNKGLELAKGIEFRIYKNDTVLDLGTITDDVIKLETTALDSDTKNHISFADDKVTIIDTVKYENFTLGQTYKIKGILIDKESGKELQVDGKNVTSEKTFKCRHENGSVDIKFTFDAKALKGKEIVVFETAFDAETDEEIVSHEDINDSKQTVVIPDIHTQATGNDGKTNLIKPLENQKIKDKVTYEKLIPGEEYELVTWLVKDGKKIRNSEVKKKFTADTANGFVIAEMTFDASDHSGETLTVYEEIYLDGEIVGEHKDLEDTKQMIKVEALAGVPKTGDDTSIIVWILSGGLALLAGTYIFIEAKRRKKISDASKANEEVVEDEIEIVSDKESDNPDKNRN